MRNNPKFTPRTKHIAIKYHQSQWGELSYEQQLNTLCDELADVAIQDGLNDRSCSHNSLLPYEEAAIVINEIKISDGMEKAMRHQVATAEARRFYTTPRNINERGVNIGGLGWDVSLFNSVDWKARQRVKASEMRSLWLCKQETGACRTRRNNARITGEEDDRCPNCKRRNESSRHLNLCQDPGRSRLFQEGATDLRRWMTRRCRKTKPSLAAVLHDFVRLRGAVTMESLASRGTPELKAAAAVQDQISWCETMHGKLALQLVAIQERYSGTHNTGLDGKSWATNMVRQLQEMLHSQWLFRNFSLHHETKGYLRIQEEKELRCRARELATLSPEDLPGSSQHLLEIDIDTEEQSFSTVSYWVLAMKAAQKEQAIRLKRTRADKRREDRYGRHWTQSGSTHTPNHLGKRDFLSMAAPPPKRPTNPKRRHKNTNTSRRVQSAIRTYKRTSTQHQQKRTRTEPTITHVLIEDGYKD